MQLAIFQVGPPGKTGFDRAPADSGQVCLTLSRLWFASGVEFSLHGAMIKCVNNVLRGDFSADATTVSMS